MDSLPRDIRQVTARDITNRTGKRDHDRANGATPFAGTDHGTWLLLAAIKLWGGPPVFVVPELPALPGRPPMLAGTDRASGWIFLHADLVDRALAGDDEALGKARAVLTHELAHVVHPHMDEGDVEAEAARALIPLGEAVTLSGITLTAEQMRDAARRLLVDPALLATRLRGLAS